MEKPLLPGLGGNDYEEFNSDLIDVPYIANCNSSKMLEKIIDFLEKDGGFPHLLQDAVERLKVVDPDNVRFVIDQVPSREVQYDVNHNIDAWIKDVKMKDQSIHQNVASTEQAARALREKMKGNECFRAKEYDDAITFYEASLSHDPSQAFIYTNMSLAHMKLEKYSLARTDCDKALDIDPNYWKGYWRRGQAKAALKQKEFAETDFHRALKLCPPSDTKNQENIRKDLRKLNNGQDPNPKKETSKPKPKPKVVEEKDPIPGKYRPVEIRECSSDEEEEEFKRLDVVDVDDSSDADSDDEQEEEETAQTESEKKKLEGNECYKLGEYAKAVECYTQAIASTTDLEQKAIYYSNRSVSQQQLNRLSEVVEDCTKALDLTVQSASTKLDATFRSKQLMRRAIALSELGQAEKSLEDFHKVAKLTPNVSSVYAHIQNLEKTVSEMHDKNVLELKAKGNALTKSKEFQKAVDAYTSALSEMKKIPVEKVDSVVKHALFTNRAFCLLQLEQFEQARHDCDFVLSNDSDNVKAVYRRGMAFVGLEMWQRAVRDYEHVIRMAPTYKSEVEKRLNVVKEHIKSTSHSTEIEQKNEEFINPSNYFDFRKAWTKLNGSNEKLYEYMCNITNFRKLFQSNLTPEESVSIFKILDWKLAEANPTKCLEILDAMGSSTQHELNVMMMSDADKKNVFSVVQKVASSDVGKMNKLKSKWEI